ncbi:hypothetical protein COC44_30635, partial [Bacillus cereus]
LAPAAETTQACSEATAMDNARSEWRKRSVFKRDSLPKHEKQFQQGYRIHSGIPTEPTRSSGLGAGNVHEPSFRHHQNVKRMASISRSAYSK